ncbi:uncharacterized protein LOC127794498 [Diospyros lotus]|uniref:uncharacterized protein LOC127794498 n=1 Tax=Diospyros lotus TaxID=55363 RepID=UPI002254F026|nr:uncharacterized protein LOC127794498 [Diospyros lotus]
MHGREGENGKRSRHMRSLPSPVAADSFLKDGRKIYVGDCALFKPPGDSRPFIGIIRWLTLNKENIVQLGVNWLYRPAEVKLGKGLLLDAEPNEVLYSFHKDEIPAASLLHPCKVAFLPKGVELPSGISSFVCRRVYDIANKCLWWLTDQDYIDERQEEVDQLLQKTQIEMHATMQPGGRSPKPTNGPTSSQLKPVSENVQSVTSFPPQSKGKKRERADHSSEPVKRERLSKTDDSDSNQFKPESILKSEISKITEKGGLVDSEGVEKLIQLMQPDKAERKLELINRSVLAAVIAATEKFDFLTQFVQLKGLLVLDEWLQDAHKGKIGDGSPKDGDRSVEEFLLVLLRALDKLPVNLQALQMCNIGKSVNHLRSHKNPEIQKKARTLVDTWKKRVEAEMKEIEAKSGSAQAVSWPRSRLPEVSHGGNRHSGVSSEVAIKSSAAQLSASKNASVKSVNVEVAGKSASMSPGPMKSALSPASGKDGQPRLVFGSISDLPSTTAKEEKSSSSSQSQNNSQSCSSEHAKIPVVSGKEDARSSTAGSISVNKMSGGSSRHRRSVNGFPGPAASVGQRETGSGRSSLHRNSALEKLSQSGLTYEKAIDVPIVEGNSHKLIVKIPNRTRSPAQSPSGGSIDDPSIMNSRASSPVLSEKLDQTDRNLKEKSDTNRTTNASDMHTESWQSNDFKDILTGSDEANGSPAAIPEDQCSIDDSKKLAEVSKAAASSSGKLYEGSFSSINALIESCVKYSEANASMSVEDNVGMKLLASVATGEMSKSDLISPTVSPRRNIPVVEYPCICNDTCAKLANQNNLSQEQVQSPDRGVVADIEKQGVVAGMWSRDAPQRGSVNFSEDEKTSSSVHEQTKTRDIDECNPSNLGWQLAAEPCVEINERLDEVRGAVSVAVSPSHAAEKALDGDEIKQLDEKVAAGNSESVVQDTKPKGGSSLITDDKVNEAHPCLEVQKEICEVSKHASLETYVEKTLETGLNVGDQTEQKRSDHLDKSEEKLLNCFDSSKNLSSDAVEITSEKVDEMDTGKQSYHVGKRTNDQGIKSSVGEIQVLASLGSTVSEQDSECLEAKVESKEVLSCGVVPQKESPALPAQEVEQQMRSRGSKIAAVEVDGTDRSPSSHACGRSDTDGKLKFDLNEGFIADEGKHGETLNLAGHAYSAPLCFVNPMPFPVSSTSIGLPASITVAAAAKGPVVPPEVLLRSKGELGWRGSAATSAFKPAEPRKFLEMPLSTANNLPDATAGKHGRTLLDIDLNVPDERILEDISRSSAEGAASTSDRVRNREFAKIDPMVSAPLRGTGCLDFDLNRVDESIDTGHYSASGSHRLAAPFMPSKSSSSGGFPNCEVRRDFDLNNGPILDEASAEPSSYAPHGRGSMLPHPSVAGLRVNNIENGTFSSWLPTGNSYPPVTIPSLLSDRGDQPVPMVATGGPPRTLGPFPGGTPFNAVVYRGSVLSSSPAVSFPSAPFQYPLFPFGSSYPLPSANFSGGSTTYTESSGGRPSFPAVNSQVLVPAAAVSSHYSRPYVVSLPDGSNNIGIDNSRKWARQGLDLNAGPGSVETEVRDETSSLLSRQLSVASSQALAEEQTRMYQQVAGSILRRKEPEGGWDSETFRYKQSSWQ